MSLNGAIDHEALAPTSFGLQSPMSIAEFARALASELDRLRVIAPRQPQEESIIVVGALRIDLEGHEATVDGAIVALQPREFALL